MYFTIKTGTGYDKYDMYKKYIADHEIKNFFHSFPEIEIIEESVKNTIIQTYYHLSPQNIRKFKILNIDNNNIKIVNLFRLLSNEDFIYNYGDEKPITIF